MANQLRVSLLRHGETDSGPVYRGRIDAQLSPQGWQQMRVATQGIQPCRVVSSPLKRCLAFANSMSAIEKENVAVDERFIEIDFGLWDGRLRDDVWQESAHEVQQFWADPMQVSPPEGENLAQVLARALPALREHITQAIAANCQHLLIISHGGVIRALLGTLLHMSTQGMFQLHLPYAGKVELVVTPFVDTTTGQTDFDISLDLSTKLDACLRKHDGIL